MPTDVLLGGSSPIAAALASLLVLAAVAAPSAAQAQPAPIVAAPYYGPEAFVAALTVHQARPMAARFAAAARDLDAGFARACVGDSALDATARNELRPAWLAAAAAWEAVDAIAQGPTITRRSARSIDFRPARPRLIAAAIKAHGHGASPPDAAALERVGTPAKGLPALEWLLWDSSAPADTAACRYATGVAAGVAAEAAALATSHAGEADRNWGDDGEAAAVRAAEIVNQWLAGLEALRWRQLGKPLAIVDTSGAGDPDPHRDIWPRPPSGSHREAWQARWETLRALAVGPAPTDGFGPQPRVPPAIVSLEALLRGRGLADEADAWIVRITAADQAVAALTAAPRARRDSGPGQGAGAAGAATGSSALPSLPVMRTALQTLRTVKQFMQERLAPSLKIALGFSDADGD